MKKSIKGITVQIGGETSGLTAALKKADDALRSTQSELKKVQQMLKFDPNNTVLLKQQQTLLNQAIKETADKLKVLQDAYEDVKKANESGAITDEQLREYQREIEFTKQKLNSYQQELEKVSKASGDVSDSSEKASKSTEKVGKSAEQASKDFKKYADATKSNAADLVKAFAAVAAAILAIGKNALDTGMDFDKAIAKVGATMGFTADELADKESEAAKTMAELRDFTLDMNSQVVFSAEEIGTALNYMALAGYDAEKSMEMLPGILNLSAAGGFEIAEASDAVTDAQSALGLSMEETTALIDKMAKTASKSNTSVEQLAYAILNIGGTAKSLAGGTTELATVLGLLADNGIKGAEGGKHLRNILLSLQKQAENGKIAIGDMAVAVYDANGEMRALPDIFSDINSAMQGMTSASKDAEKIALFNKTDLAAVNALLGTSSERWSDLAGEIDDSAGAAQAMAEVQLDNLAGDLAIMQSAAENAKIAISDKLDPSLRKAAQLGTKLITQMTDKFGKYGLSGAIEEAHKVLEEELGSASNVIFGIENATKAAIAAFITYKSTLVLTNAINALKEVNNLLVEGKTLAEAFKAVGLANPFVLLMTAITAAGIALNSYIKTQTDLIDEAANSYDLLDDKQKAIVDNIKKIGTSISDTEDSFKENADAIDTQAAAVDTMVARLYELDSAEELSIAQKAEMKAIVNALNSSYEDLNIQLDDETGHLITEKGAIDDVVDSMKKRAKATAAESALVEYYSEQVKAEQNLKDISEKRTEAREKLNALEQEHNEQLKKLKELEREIETNGFNGIEQEQEYNNLVRAVENTTTALEDQRDVVGELDGAYVTASNSSRRVQENIESLTGYIIENDGVVSDSTESVSKALDDVADSAETAAGKTEKVFTITEEQVDDTLDKIDELAEAYNSKINNETGILENWVEKNLGMDEDTFDISAWQNALDSTQSELNDWDKKLLDLADRTDKNGKKIVNEGLLEHLKTLGPEGKKYVEALTNASDEELAKFSKTWEETYTSIPKIAEKQYDELKTTTNKKIKEMLRDVETENDEVKNIFGRLGMYGIDGYINAWNDPEKRAELEEVVRSLVRQAEEAIADEQDSNSPSKLFRKLGDYAGEGYALGISDEAKAAQKAASQMVSAAESAVSRSALKAPAMAVSGGIRYPQADTSGKNSYEEFKDIMQSLVSGNYVQKIVLDDNGQDVLAEAITPKIDILLGTDIRKKLGGV